MRPFSKKQHINEEMKLSSVGTNRAIFERPSVYLSVSGCPSGSLIIEKFLKKLFPEQAIHWDQKPHFKEIDTYVIFYSCAYHEEELFPLIDGMAHAQEVLKNEQLKPEAHIVMILYRDLRVDFPERKLQREKVMSNMFTEKFIQCKALINHDRLHIIHEFGIYNLEDSLQYLKGCHFYFKMMA